MKTSLILSSLFLFALAACQFATKPVQPLPVPESQPLPVPGFPTGDGSQGGTGSGLCTNPYFPVVEGAAWAYNQTTSSGTVTSTHTITDVGTDGFLEQTANPDLTFVITWKCSAEGMYWLQSTGGMFAAVFQSGAGNGTVETLSYSGVSIPANMQPGDTWTTDEEITAKSFGVNETFTIHTDYHAVGFESVTVPAGTFNALRVDLTMTNTSQTLPVSITGTIWFVVGVGQVKNVGFAGDVISELELASYSIP